jgi:hypothetical protein
LNLYEKLVCAFQTLHTNVFDLNQLALMEHRFAESMAVLTLVFPSPPLHVELRDGVGQGLENRPRDLSITAIGFYRSKKGCHTGCLCYEPPQLQRVLRYTAEAMQMYPLNKALNTGKYYGME